ncbi:hypothetical protein [Pontibacter ramchanderi]|uniref:Uncharacterized protein n=1 Tax=Pontibacter ramchanderi TaxID=1179743 RepID=A0A2N3UAE8_9BACT|nr:hypothetical protein [Pontibacter ramchanderi]PKV66341.1 hypothetical protein BD749_1466 [Pontibacter ramchanderi]
MKKIVVSILVIICIGIYGCDAQSQTNSRLPDLIDPSAVAIKINMETSSIFKLNDTPTALTSVLGKPKSIDNVRSEQDNKSYYLYTYKHGSFYFDVDKLVSININSGSVIMSFNGQNHIRVGDNISSLQDIFPNSYHLKEDGQLFVNFKTSSGTATDDAILFEYDAKGVITNIII